MKCKGGKEKEKERTSHERKRSLGCFACGKPGHTLVSVT